LVYADIHSPFVEHIAVPALEARLAEARSPRGLRERGYQEDQNPNLEKTSLEHLHKAPPQFGFLFSTLDRR
jgi:hypothetical protein